MPDLTLARAAAESLFDAECVVTRDRQGRADDFRDPTTGQLTRPSDDAGSAYSGPCLIRPSKGLGQNRPREGGADQYLDRYDGRLPVTATGVGIGDVLTVTAAPNDPDLVDEQFTVLQISAGSHAITRMLTLQLRTRGPAL